MSSSIGKTRLRFHARRHRLARVRSLVQTALLDDPSGAFTTSDVEEILLGLQESLSNASRHNQDPLVELSFWIRNGRFHACVRGRGPPFDPDRVPAPNRNRPREHGYGLILLNRTMDRVSYRRAGSWNLLRLVRAGSNCLTDPNCPDGVKSAEGSTRQEIRRAFVQLEKGPVA